MGGGRLLLALVACGCAGDLRLSETEQAMLNIYPGSYDFGTVQVGQTSGAGSISVQPYYVEQYEVVNAFTWACPGFSITVPPAPQYVYYNCDYYDPFYNFCYSYTPYGFDISATFSPSVAGAQSCVLSIHTQNTGVYSVTFTGYGEPPPVDVDVQPGSIAFGDVRVATTSAAATLYVRNYGGQPLNVSSISASSGFSIGGPGAYSLGPGGMQTHDVTCSPSAVGSLGGSITVQNNDPTSPTITIPLSCNGIDSNLDISPSPATIPTTRVGEPATRAVTLQNTGGASMSVESVTLSGAGLSLDSAFATGTYGPGQASTATVRFAADVPGEATGSIVVTYDGGQQRTLQISARALSTSMSVTPDGSVDLGPICVGSSSDQLFSILANDQGPFSVLDITTPAAPFTLDAPALPAQVQGGGANLVAFTVGVAPTEPGALSATVAVDTDIPGAEPRTIQLSAVALPAGVSGSPEIVQLAATTVGTTSLAEEIHVTNCGTAPVSLANGRIEGTDVGEFSLVRAPANPTLGPGETAEWLVVFSPTSPGMKAATFSVDHDGGTVTLALGGEGLGGGGEMPGDDSIPSYYACSTGSAPGGALVLLAGALLLRRRRSATARR